MYVLYRIWKKKDNDVNVAPCIQNKVPEIYLVYDIVSFVFRRVVAHSSEERWNVLRGDTT
jgi:hypothetical protein